MPPRKKGTTAASKKAAEVNKEAELKASEQPELEEEQFDFEESDPKSSEM